MKVGYEIARTCREPYAVRGTYLPIGVVWENRPRARTDAPSVPEVILVSIIIFSPLSRSMPGCAEPGRSVGVLISVVVVFTGSIFARVGTVFPPGCVR